MSPSRTPSGTPVTVTRCGTFQSAAVNVTDVADREIRVVFTPHLIPMDRGILSTCYAEPTGEFDDQSLLDLIKNFYANERFVRATPNLPTTKQVAGTNFCDIAVRTVRGRVIVISAIDNLVNVEPNSEVVRISRFARTCFVGGGILI